jgi:hypothetical protein
MQKKGFLLEKSEILIKLYSDLEKLQKKYDETTKDYPFQMVYRMLEKIENLNTIIKKQEEEIEELEYQLDKEEEETICGSSVAESYRFGTRYQPKNECCALLRDDVTYNSSHSLL